MNQQVKNLSMITSIIHNEIYQVKHSHTPSIGLSQKNMTLSERSLKQSILAMYLVGES